MLEETRAFVEHVAFDGTGHFEALLTAEYTMAPAILSGIYGVAIPEGGGVMDAPPWRAGAGILGHASVLSTYAYSDQSSPIRRGLFVRRNLLCQDLPPPPPEAGGVPEVDPASTTRERFKQHSADPFCTKCHQFIDDVGFGFERFDPIGAYRLVENGGAIDPSGDMNDVEGLNTDTSAPYETLAELGGILAAAESAKRCFATQVFRFASGRREVEDDACTIDGIVSRWAEAGYDIQELIVAVVGSPHFSVRRGVSP